MFKKVVALMSAMALTVGMLSGCGIKSNTPVIGRLVGLDDDQVFKIGKLICGKPEYMLALMDEANQMKATLGQGIKWDSKINKKHTLEEYVLANVKEEVGIKYTMAAIAKSMNIKLTDTEINSIETAATTYYNSLTDAEKKFTGAKLSDVVTLYKNYKLADKAYNSETEDVDVSVSDEEARVIKIEYIRMNTEKLPEAKIQAKLKEVRKIVKNDWQPFSREAKQYSLDSTYQKNIKKNEATSEFDKAAFALSKGQISKVLAIGNDRYLIYCVDSYLKKESAANKAEIIRQKKQNTFALKYDNYLDDNTIDFNDRSVEGIEFPTTADFKTTSLWDIYQTIK